nr:DNA recombination protein RmuC [Mycoplasmopsis bovis]
MKKNRLWFKQYQINPGKNQEAVDFAMKIKTKSESEEIEQIIPIDCKFPKEKWDRYLDSKSINDKVARILKNLKKLLKRWLKVLMKNILNQIERQLLLP